MEHPHDICYEVRFALPLYVGQDLEPEEMATVEAHLAGCASCEAQHERARDAREVLLASGRQTAEGPAPSLWEGVRAGLIEEGLLPSAGTAVAEIPRIHRPWIQRIRVGGVAAAAALLFSFTLAGFMGSDGRPTAPHALGSGGDTVGADPVVHHSAVAEPQDPGAMAGHGALRKVGAKGMPMYPRAIELRPEQGLLVPPPPARDTLASTPETLRPADR